MKKRNLIFLFVLLFLAIFGISFYNIYKANSKIVQKQSEVKLLSFAKSDYEEFKLSSYVLNDEEEIVETPSIRNQLLLLQRGELEFKLTITLDNKKDYHILDFNLSCDDEKLKIKINDVYVKLSSINSINWSGDTNEKCELEFYSESEEFLKTLTITSIFYVDRENLNVKNLVDLNDKESVKIYREKGITMKYIGVVDNFDKFEMYASEHLVLDNVFCNGEKVEFIDGIYTILIPKSQYMTFKVNYQIIIDDEIFEGYYQATTLFLGAIY